MSAPIRIQRRRTKGWKMPPNTVSVCRPGKWGNPFRVAPAFESEEVKFPAVTAESAVELYREWIARALLQWPSTADPLAELRGKNLACWCQLHCPCHADVLLELANPTGGTMSNRAPCLSRSATFVLDLAKKPDGYLAPGSEVIDELRNAGLVMTQNIGDGFMLVKAIQKPAKRRCANGQWIWPQERIAP